MISVCLHWFPLVSSALQWSSVVLAGLCWSPMVLVVFICVYQSVVASAEIQWSPMVFACFQQFLVVSVVLPGSNSSSLLVFSTMW